jgi:hypothetical protein
LKSSHDLTQQRLHNQFITRPTFEKPGDVVKWFGAVQAQDYLGALWAVGLRMRDATETAVEKAIADRTIVRTWPMRGTLHFVAPEDIRWMLKLMTPRVIANNAQRIFRDYGLDAAAITRSRDVVENALAGGKCLPRTELYKVLEESGISPAPQGNLHIVGWLAMGGVICFGPRQGKQQTFALLDEWVPVSRVLERDEALAELAKRYFTSHGPATVQDFAWWSGLTAGEARAGLEKVKSEFVQEVVDGKTYWLSVSTPAADDTPPTAHLLPAFDEYTVAYTDRSAILDPAHAEAARIDVRGSVLNPSIEVDGRIVGTWKRVFEKGSVIIKVQPFGAPSDIENEVVAEAADRYGNFLDMPAILL